MSRVQKACPVVFRMLDRGPEVLAFERPSAGKQFVKGTIEAGEKPIDAAKRELREESGLVVNSPMTSLGVCEIGTSRQRWHFFRWQGLSLPDTWQHETTDDHGHTFSFFWHPIDVPLDQYCHSIFEEACEFFAPRLLR
ncbi:8-oxo-dGTP pyrophosphatase MutT (NUDIX family) [Rhizobium pisi]|uniref:8-oxo-dGTP pyrophosphatase MutT (NUDIX family) n=1 Tax=Rhizobium pisi TaxID=574561 RepID=A0A3R9GTW8_9HYPH|nr:NUDIX domain-containing protein [Rhizobium pisi]MBB3138723.1 8-oxo-dGTP pyrophosphatase MutT (NUDIX family) [Rhizobium pisi]RSB61788.1 NUDIX domain-containing protein [Rhizobium pisi]